MALIPPRKVGERVMRCGGEIISVNGHGSAAWYVAVSITKEMWHEPRKEAGGESPPITLSL